MYFFFWFFFYLFNVSSVNFFLLVVAFYWGGGSLCSYKEVPVLPLNFALALQNSVLVSVIILFDFLKCLD